MKPPSVNIARSTAKLTAVRSCWSETDLNRTQQFASRAARSIAVRVRFRAMTIDLIRLARHDTEQLAEVLHKMTPNVRRHSQSTKERSQMLWRRPAFVTANLPSRPVQQIQIIRSRHRQKSLVAATLTSLVNAGTSLTRALLQIDRSQMTGRSCCRCSSRRTGHSISHRRATSVLSHAFTTSGSARSSAMSVPA